MDGCAGGLSFAVARRAAELGATATQLGWLGALWIGIYAGAALLTGPLSDRLGRRTVARTGCLLAAGLTLACGWTTHVGWLLVLTGLFGAAMAGFWPAIIAWLTEDSPDAATVNARLGKFSIAWNLGLIIGFAQTGFIFRHWPQLAFLVPAALALLNVVVLSLPAPTAADDPPVTPVQVVPGRNYRQTAWVANLGLSLVMSGAGALFPQLATHFHVDADIHGYLMAGGRAAALAVFVVVPALAFWRTRLWPLWVAQALAAVGVAILGWAETVPWFALSFILAGAVSGYTYQASIVFTMEEMTEKGKGGGLHEFVNGAGMALGPMVAGWAGAGGSLRAPYWVCAGILAVLVIGQMLLAARRPQSIPR